MRRFHFLKLFGSAYAALETVRYIADMFGVLPFYEPILNIFSENQDDDSSDSSEVDNNFKPPNDSPKSGRDEFKVLYYQAAESNSRLSVTRLPCEISFYNKDLKFIKSKIRDMDVSKVLNLAMVNCQLEEIPSFLNNFKSLKILNLSQNKIKDCNLSFRINLPPDVSNNNSSDLNNQSSLAPSLFHINLSQNSLTKFDIALLNDVNFLKRIDLSFNKIDSIISSSVINKSLELQVLNLCGNQLKCLTENTFKYLHNLTELNLSKNKIKNVKFGFDELISLKKLDISYNRMKELDLSCFVKNVVLGNDSRPINVFQRGASNSQTSSPRNFSSASAGSRSVSDRIYESIRNVGGLAILEDSEGHRDTAPVIKKVIVKEVNASHNKLKILQNADNPKLFKDSKFNLAYNSFSSLNKDKAHKFFGPSSFVDETGKDFKVIYCDDPLLDAVDNENFSWYLRGLKYIKNKLPEKYDIDLPRCEQLLNRIKEIKKKAIDNKGYKMSRESKNLEISQFERKALGGALIVFNRLYDPSSDDKRIWACMPNERIKALSYFGHILESVIKNFTQCEIFLVNMISDLRSANPFQMLSSLRSLFLLVDSNRPKATSCKRFVVYYVVSEREDVFDALFSDKAPEIAAYWKGQLADLLGFDFEYVPCNYNIEKDPYKSFEGNVLRDYFKTFNPNRISLKLSIALLLNPEFVNEVIQLYEKKKYIIKSEDSPREDDWRQDEPFKPVFVKNFLVHHKLIEERYPELWPQLQHERAMLRQSIGTSIFPF